jgi:hypothetical protein
MATRRSSTICTSAERERTGGTVLGYEYKLDFEVLDPTRVDERLRGVAGFEGLDCDRGLYAYRRMSAGDIPDLFAKLEADGVYLCDNGPGREVIKDIRAALEEFAPDADLREL